MTAVLAFFVRWFGRSAGIFVVGRQANFARFFVKTLHDFFVQCAHFTSTIAFQCFVRSTPASLLGKFRFALCSVNGSQSIDDNLHINWLVWRLA